MSVAAGAEGAFAAGAAPVAPQIEGDVHRHSGMLLGCMLALRSSAAQGMSGCVPSRKAALTAPRPAGQVGPIHGSVGMLSSVAEEGLVLPEAPVRDVDAEAEEGAVYAAPAGKDSAAWRRLVW